MEWVLIIIGVIIFIVIMKNVGRKRKVQNDDVFTQIIQLNRAKQVREEEISRSRISDKDEILAQRITNLLFSIRDHEFKNNKLAYENAAHELKVIGDKIEEDGGRERWRQIMNRVKVLCGNHFIGLFKYLNLIENSIS